MVDWFSLFVESVRFGFVVDSVGGLEELSVAGGEGGEGTKDIESYRKDESVLTNSIRGLLSAYSS